jgi:uncharacterized protein
MSTQLISAAGDVMCRRLLVADRPLSRMKGLLGRAALDPDEGLLLRPAGTVHTGLMRFPIDVVFLDGSMQVLRVEPDMRPWRMAGQRGARAVLEMAAGAAERAGIVPGMRLALRQPVPA